MLHTALIDATCPRIGFHHHGAKTQLEGQGIVQRDAVALDGRDGAVPADADIARAELTHQRLGHLGIPSARTCYGLLLDNELLSYLQPLHGGHLKRSRTHRNTLGRDGHFACKLSVGSTLDINHGTTLHTTLYKHRFLLAFAAQDNTRGRNMERLIEQVGTLLQEDGTAQTALVQGQGSQGIDMALNQLAVIFRGGERIDHLGIGNQLIRVAIAAIGEIEDAVSLLIGGILQLTFRYRNRKSGLCHTLCAAQTRDTEKRKKQLLHML